MSQINKSWRECIIEVLRQKKQALHFTEIAAFIVEERLKVTVGATPAKTVSAELSESVKNDSESPFIKVARGTYGLREVISAATSSIDGELGVSDSDDPLDATLKLIPAFGMYWQRNLIDWQQSTPKIQGVQLQGSVIVDFGGQTGIYILYDNHRPIYVGRSTEKLCTRLRAHTRDRLAGRWNRFSWFGTHNVANDGTLQPAESYSMDSSLLIQTLEALLIEAMEPALNRRRGDDFGSAEYHQHVSEV